MLTAADEHRHQQTQHQHQQQSNSAAAGTQQLSHQLFVFGGSKVVDPLYGGKPGGDDAIGLDGTLDGGGDDYEDGDYDEDSDGEEERLSSVRAMIGNNTNEMLASQPSTAGT